MPAAVRKAARSLIGTPWPARAEYVVFIDSGLFPLHRVAALAMGRPDLSTETARRWVEWAGFVTIRLEPSATPAIAGTVRDMDQMVSTSQTPSDTELEPYRGQWVAMAGGEVVAADADVDVVVGELTERGMVNDRLFKVPAATLSEFASPVP